MLITAFSFVEFAIIVIAGAAPTSAYFLYPFTFMLVTFCLVLPITIASICFLDPSSIVGRLAHRASSGRKALNHFWGSWETRKLGFG
jgi:hypothetical protein